MRTLKKYRMQLLLIFALAQLAYLLSMPVTRLVGMLLARAVLSGHYILYVLLAPCLLSFGVLFNQKLKALDWRWLEWSPWHVKANFVLLPLKNKWLWAPYGLLLGACMPLLALVEEVIFRNGTTNWVKGALWGALAFGLLHLLSFVTLRMTLYLILVGAILVQVYMLDGLLAVFVVHACYNLLALALLIVELHVKRAPALIRRASARVAAAT
ncbi:MAG: type II CAAX prenyl endopeptidase Rce1 family protein [Solirubrobacteraceae bacterium]